MAASTDDYLERLKTWGLYSLAVLAVSISTALVQRFVGVKADVPPPPPVSVVVQPVPGSPAPPTVTFAPPQGQ